MPVFYTTASRRCSLCLAGSYCSSLGKASQQCGKCTLDLLSAQMCFLSEGLYHTPQGPRHVNLVGGGALCNQGLLFGLRRMCQLQSLPGWIILGWPRQENSIIVIIHSWSLILWDLMWKVFALLKLKNMIASCPSRAKEYGKWWIERQCRVNWYRTVHPVRYWNLLKRPRWSKFEFLDGCQVSNYI